MWFNDWCSVINDVFILCVLSLSLQHWIANNLFGLAFALNGVEFLQLNRISTGCILLGGLFVYDIFWVSCCRLHCLPVLLHRWRWQICLWFISRDVDSNVEELDWWFQVIVASVLRKFLIFQYSDHRPSHRLWNVKCKTALAISAASALFLWKMLEILHNNENSTFINIYDTIR